LHIPVRKQGIFSTLALFYIESLLQFSYKNIKANAKKPGRLITACLLTYWEANEKINGGSKTKQNSPDLANEIKPDCFLRG